MGGGGGGGGRPEMGGGDEGASDPHASDVPLPPDPEGRAEDLRLQGKCDEAVPILRRLTQSGPDDDIAKFNLGLCLLDIGKADQDAQRSARVEHEAAQWILGAANDGLPNAQLRSITLYLDGSGVRSDPVEAGKWSLIYHSNGMRVALSLPDIPQDVQTRLESVLTGQTWLEAHSRADSWVPIAALGLWIFDLIQLY